MKPSAHSNQVTAVLQRNDQLGTPAPSSPVARRRDGGLRAARRPPDARRIRQRTSVPRHGDIKRYGRNGVAPRVVAASAERRIRRWEERRRRSPSPLTGGPLSDAPEAGEAYSFPTEGIDRCVRSRTQGIEETLHGNAPCTFMGCSLLLGLEFLVAGDIIKTVAIEPTRDRVIVLTVIVLVRTVLSLSIDVEIDGRWPWQAAEQARLVETAPTGTPEVPRRPEGPR